MSEENKQPTYVIPEDSVRNYGKNAQKNNIAAAKVLAETVRTTLGPKGMDKMMVDSNGDVVVTNDGVTILEEMDIDHPAAKMVVEIAKTQEDEIGDGTTTAVVFAGELLKKAEKLLEKNIHPTIITKGYRDAAKKAQEILSSISKSVSNEDEDLIKKIALTAMTGKGAESSKERLADLISKAVINLSKGEGDFDRSNIRIEKKLGGNADQSKLIEGVLIDKEKIHPSMPSNIDEAKIALLDTPLEIKETEVDAKISIDDPSKMQGFLDMEEKMINDMVNKVVESGANVVLCQKGIDDMAQHYLSKKGIYAVRRVKKSNMEDLSKATGGRIVNNIKELSENDLGEAGNVREVKVGGEEMTYVTKCHNPKTVTLLIRGGTEHVVEEVKRALEDAIGDVSAALKGGKVISGAGSCEMEIYKQLQKYAESLSGREQMAVKSFADAMDIIPQTLAENAGLDPIDIITSLKSSHDRGEVSTGLDVFKGEMMNSWDEGIIEPSSIKKQAISSATDVAVMILRIDDVISSNKKSDKNSEDL